MGPGQAENLNVTAPLHSRLPDLVPNPFPCRVRAWASGAGLSEGLTLPVSPHPQENPWGTFLGTWQMPRRIPQPRPNLTARNSAGAARLISQVESSPLYKASNGFGLQAAFPHCVEQVPEETFEEHCARTQDTPALPSRLSDQEEGTGDPTPTGTPPAQVLPSPPGTRGIGRVATPGATGRALASPEAPQGSPDPALQCRSPLIG
ncbi:protein Flattop-like [Hypanus sabinus]|uniref:protein Flattop-like n=1 Tax=Hypanus sabinus TaxID=79690 RepID=UPI0028C4715D|nr:protein Flattop-like [Hypanus sabinus]